MSKISKERKITYYIGIGTGVVGFLLFISFFFSFVSSMRTFEPPSFLPPVIGIVLIIAGSFIASIGAHGAAGSGLVLDPEQAREDLKPFNEAKGGMINDVISNIDAIGNITKPQDQKEVIKVKCRECGALNDEDAKFCKSCGTEL
jgi:ribosomal protein L40E